MNPSMKASNHETVSSGPHVAEWLTALMVPLVLVAAAGGLWLSNLYRDPAAIAPALRGQDLVTLVALPFLLLTLSAARRGSTRATLIWIGLLGYLFYTYLGAAVGYFLNPFLLLYIAIFSLTLFALIASLGNLNPAGVKTNFDASTPRGPVVAFLLLMAVMLGALEVSQIAGYMQSGIIPKAMQLAGGNNYFVYTLDLGIVVPLAMLSAMWLWQRLPWGYALSGIVLIKSAAMGLALLAMNWFNYRANQTTDGPEMLLTWAFIALGGLGLSVWFFRHCKT